jgi:hypothetical protein
VANREMAEITLAMDFSGFTRDTEANRNCRTTVPSIDSRIRHPREEINEDHYIATQPIGFKRNHGPNPVFDAKQLYME